MSVPFISVCLLAHNNAAYIGTAVESVLAQSFQRWEMLVSDDASFDETREIIQPYLSDARIRYVRHVTNLGQAANWAYAIQHGVAPVIATLHADDAWERHALQTFAEAFMEDDERDLVCANWGYYDGSLQQKVLNGPVTAACEMGAEECCTWLVETNHTLPSAAAFSRRVSVSAGVPDSEYGMLCDRDYFLRIALAARRCRVVPEQILRYRQNDSGVTARFTKGGRFQEEMIKFVEKIPAVLRTHQNGERLVKVLETAFGKELALCGFAAAVDGRYVQARHWSARAVELAGWSLCSPSVLRGMLRVLRAHVRIV